MFFNTSDHKLPIRSFDAHILHIIQILQKSLCELASAGLLLDRHFVDLVFVGELANRRDESSGTTTEDFIEPTFLYSFYDLLYFELSQLISIISKLK